MAISGVTLSTEGGKLFLRGHPAPERGQVDETALGHFIAESGFGHWASVPDALPQAVHACNTSPTPFAALVAEQRDAAIQVQISDDAMQATVHLSPAQGGKAASIQDVIRALVDAGVTVGVDHAALLEACQADVPSTVVAAHGTLPQEGRDSEFQELVPETSDRAPKLNDEGLIDYREYSGLTLVEPGAAVMRRIPAVPGIDGQTVLGGALPPPPVRDDPYAEGLSGVAPAPDDPEVLTASISGTPVRVSGGIMVEPMLRVPEVNLATGHIRFDGTVQVDGDVIQGMKVVASGDIFVGGTVEGGALEARGNITVKGGIIAQAAVTCEGALTARFAESAVLHAGTVIALDDAALDCTLSAHNQIRVGVKNPQRGRLIGGSATAKMLLAAPVVGSSKSGATRVVVGCDPLLDEQYKALEARLAQEKANEDNLQKLCKHLVAIKDPKGMLEKAKLAWRQAAQVWGKSLVEKGALDQLRATMLSARLEVGVTTSGAVDLTCGMTRLLLRKEYGKGAFSLDRDGRLVFTGPDGKAYPAA